MERDGEDNSDLKGLESGNSFALMQTPQGEDWWWRKGQLSRVFLVSLADGSRRTFSKELKYNSGHSYTLSPNERYIIYYDRLKRGYESYEIQKNITHSITQGTNVFWDLSLPIEDVDPFFGKAILLNGLCGWMNGGDNVLIYDSSRDIWQFDPSGKKQPICLTPGYGRKHHIYFTLFNRESGALIGGGYCPNLTNGERVIMQGVNSDTKDLGLYRLLLNGREEPKLINDGRFAAGSGTLLLAKARDKDAYLLRRSSFNDAPNLFLMKDYKSIIRLTDIQPQRAYRWYETELINYQLPNGEKCQGILYKPEGMDTTIKHPVIFNYYEHHSNDLNRYLEPQWMNADLNVPYMVSRGYMIFKPDIHAKVGHPGAGAVETMESAAKYLSKRPYVDSRKLGLMGHSYGGYETNYIISHSHLFAAAVEGAGISDFISGYLLPTGKDRAAYWLYETFQNRIGATLWQRPDLYIENSPIFRADRVTTPLLMMQNKLDMNVTWTQGVEFFLALRRLNKDVWMLQYDNEEHQLDKPENKKDFTIRVTQFFDHYLMNVPPPKWLTQGIPYKDKGLTTGYELDTSGKMP